MTDPVVTVTGDASGGFIVELHNGDRHESYGVMADNADAASAEALRRFYGSDQT